MRDHDADPTLEQAADVAPAATQSFDPKQVSRILTLPPPMRDAAISVLQQRYGNGYVQRLLSEQAASTPTPHPMLREGSNGPSVIELQQKLDTAGATLATDGAFGPLTRNEVVRFQTGHQLSADGIVGPQTWTALDANDSPEPAYDPLTMAVGDAEDTAAPTQQASTTEGFASSQGATVSAAAPVRPSPVVHPMKAALLAGAFEDRGGYNATDTGFTDVQLEQLLGLYGAFWSIDVAATPRPDIPATGNKNAGDSAGKGVTSQPPWVKEFQNAIIGRPKWDDDDRATQRLVEAYVRHWTTATAGALPPGAEQMFHQIGASETNGQADAFGGQKGQSAWCGSASTNALILGMYNRGIRFKSATHDKHFAKELESQAGAFTRWTNAKGARHVVTGSQAWNEPLQPGDIISVINGGDQGPLSGHVATVVSYNHPQLVYASGNAAGVVAYEGAVRIEEVTRETPPSNYDYQKFAKPFNDNMTAKQAEKAAIKREANDTAQIRANVDYINSNAPSGMPSYAAKDASSIGGLLAFLTRLPQDLSTRADLIKHAQALLAASNDYQLAEVQQLQAEATEAKLATVGDVPVDRQDRRYQAGLHAPATAGVSWVVSVVRTGALTQSQMLANGQVSVTPNDPALELGPTLAEQCPDTPASVINTAASSK